jgi:phosphoribosylformylglycinamidine synthase subunit PurQ / glutaminase
MNALILAGNGINCEQETQHACLQAKFDTADIRYGYNLLNGSITLDSYQLVVFPGGFLDGDDLGAGVAMANRVRATQQPGKAELLDQLRRFVDSGRLILGICNGFQVLVKLGLLPASNQNDLIQTVTLTHNTSGKFEDRWVYLLVDQKSPCVFTKGIEQLFLPVRHGEGRLLANDDAVLESLITNHQVPLRYYSHEEAAPTETYPMNPNGSPFGIASLSDPTGHVLGLMPHPEAYTHFTNHPYWTRLPWESEQGEGLRIFQNAYMYLKN